MKILNNYPMKVVVCDNEKEMVVIDGRMWSVKDVKEMILDSLISSKHAYEDLLKELK